MSEKAKAPVRGGSPIAARTASPGPKRFGPSTAPIVVWSTTIGAVLGPNLFGPGEAVRAAIGLPPLTGAFAFSLIAQLGAASVYAFALRPDPLLTALAGRDANAP